MPTSFFDSLKNQPWTPPTLPALDDPTWSIQFESADHQEKTNLANAWLWRFNQTINPLYTDIETQEAFISSIIAQQHHWLRKSMPFSNKDLFKDAMFDGSVESLMQRTTRLTAERRTIIKRGIEGLWFGENTERVKAVKLLSAELSDLMQHHGDLPRLKNTLQTMAWEVAENNPDDLFLRACAARISVLHGMNNNDMPGPWHKENTAWHGVAKLTNLVTTNVMYCFVNIFQSTITQANPAVAAYNLPTVMNMLSLSVMQMDKQAIGLTSVLDKPIGDVTHYDILRAWIPSKTAYWNSAQALELSFEDACAHVASELFATPSAEQVNLPEGNLASPGI